VTVIAPNLVRCLLGQPAILENRGGLDGRPPAGFREETRRLEHQQLRPAESC
jgi:hypothetical protein